MPAGGTVEVPFLLTWHYPNKYNGAGTWMGCHYATRWPDARAVLREARRGLRGSCAARPSDSGKTFYDSTLPYWLLDCVTANAAIIRHIGVVFRIANGDVYGWEGSNGCCQPTCTHVWGYEQTLARLFPDLERDMRRIDFKHQQRADGGVNNRTDVPSPPRPTGEQPFADGHASCILKAYREALNSARRRRSSANTGRTSRRAVDYLIGRDAESHGGQPAGVSRRRPVEHLRRGAARRDHLHQRLLPGRAARRRGMGAAHGRRRHRRPLPRGVREGPAEARRAVLERRVLPAAPARLREAPGRGRARAAWPTSSSASGGRTSSAWVTSCPRTRSSPPCEPIFKYNWKTDLTGWKHMPRAFAGARDKGLIICTWPKGGRPGHVMLYSDEVWTGIEYQVAAHMIYEGMIEEGLAIVKGARDRYDGIPRAPIPRNPWNEIECGGHYARAMSSWSLLLAALRLGIRRPTPGAAVHRRGLRRSNFKAFFSGPEGWGSPDPNARRNGAAATRSAMCEGRLAVANADAWLQRSPPKRVKMQCASKSVDCRSATMPACSRFR